MPDFDLCGKCYAKMGASHGQACVRHDFKCILVDWSEQAYHRQGHHLAHRDWGHMRSPHAHDPTCQRKQSEPSAAAAEQEEKVSEPARFDLSFPVVVEDGRQLVIQWNIGDKPLDTAEKFAARHSIPGDELPTIVAFIEAATDSTHTLQAEGSDPASETEELQAAAATEPEWEVLAEPAKAEDKVPMPETEMDRAALDRNEGTEAKKPCNFGNSTEDKPPAGSMEDQQSESAAVEVKRCPGGCGYLVTWHATHCCAACKLSGKHGPRCNRQLARNSECAGC